MKRVREIDRKYIKPVLLREKGLSENYKLLKTLKSINETVKHEEKVPAPFNKYNIDFNLNPRLVFKFKTLISTDSLPLPTEMKKRGSIFAHKKADPYHQLLENSIINTKRRVIVPFIIVSRDFLSFQFEYTREPHLYRIRGDVRFLLDIVHCQIVWMTWNLHKLLAEVSFIYDRWFFIMLFQFCIYFKVNFEEPKVVEINEDTLSNDSSLFKTTPF